MFGIYIFCPYVAEEYIHNRNEKYVHTNMSTKMPSKLGASNTNSCVLAYQQAPVLTAQ